MLIVSVRELLVFDRLVDVFVTPVPRSKVHGFQCWNVLGYFPALFAFLVPRVWGLRMADEEGRVLVIVLDLGLVPQRHVLLFVERG